LEQDYQKLMEHDQSVLINRISYDSEMISRVVSYMAGILINFLAIAVYGLFITRLSSFLAAIVVVLGLVLIGSIGLWVKQVSLVGAAASLVQRDLFSRMLNGVQALRTIRLYGAEKSFEEDFSRTSSLIEATSLKRAKLMHASHPVRDVGLLIVLGTFLWIAHQLHTSVGVTAIIVAMLYRMLPHINSIEQQAMDIFSLVEPLHETARTIFPDYAEEPAPRPAHAFDRKFETIEFHNVSYKYPTAEYMTLVDVNFRFNRGALVVINGASGSGKSTVVNLLAGLLKPGSGTIFLDDVALCDIERSSWVRCLAFAGQDVEMIDGSLADNIRLARPDISDQDVRAALSAVEALDFVDRLPNGIHTNVGDRGFRLSGGQRQRIGLARALVAQPEILILDEATNAIDLATEALIFANIDKMLPGATKIIITHRENVENADLTVMLDWGYVVRLHAPADPASCFDKRESAQ
jgi:ABC-type bacteriocin/lantibiotic exporter with double-glycine peptidase domain